MRIAYTGWHAQLDVKDACNVARLLVHERRTKCACYTNPVQPKSRAVLGCLIPLKRRWSHCLLLKMILFIAMDNEHISIATVK